MIGRLQGMSYDTGTEMATVVVGCIGYEVHTLEPVRNQPDIVLWIHTHYPQDAAPELYGFRQREQRDMFRRLLKIKGVGPKVAQRIVAAGFNSDAWTVEANRMAMIQRLNSIRGVGATLAQRICEELS